MQYELFYLVGERNESRLDDIKHTVNAILVGEGATLVDPELTEKRKLAYEIKHQNRGTYVTRRFDLPELDYWSDENITEKEFGIDAITKKLNLSNDVLRFIIIKTEDLPALGTKEERKARELKEAKQAAPATQKPVRHQRTSSPATPAPKAEVKKEETKVAEEVVEAPQTKEVQEAQEKDIDKKLDEILNI